MSDEARRDLNRRLRCVHGHLAATARMIERGEDDLAVAHQLQAIRGVLAQIQVQLLRAWLSECSEWLSQPAMLEQIERDLKGILKIRRRHGFDPRR